MPDESLFLKALSEFAQTLAHRYEVSDALMHLAEHVVDILDLAGAGVSVRDDDGLLRPVTPVNELTVDLEGTEEAKQEGPCIDAFHDGVLVVERVSDAVERWPAWTARAIDRGIVNVAGVPMRAGDDVIGAINLYSARHEPFTEAELQTAQVLADMASAYVVGASELDKSRRTNEQLQAALESRVVIEQAKGLIAGERGVSVDEAFEVLRSHARRRGASLRSVAEAVVRLGMRPG
jgi:transcriptional regulator with GAF, ATPase, and Fis domain